MNNTILESNTNLSINEVKIAINNNKKILELSFKNNNQQKVEAFVYHFVNFDVYNRKINESGFQVVRNANFDDNSVYQLPLIELPFDTECVNVIIDYVIYDNLMEIKTPISHIESTERFKIEQINQEKARLASQAQVQSQIISQNPAPILNDERKVEEKIDKKILILSIINAFFFFVLVVYTFSIMLNRFVFGGSRFTSWFYFILIISIVISQGFILLYTFVKNKTAKLVFNILTICILLLNVLTIIASWGLAV